MKEEKKIKIIMVIGPTATGKTKLAVKLARNFNGEIVSADSRQVYRGLDIGSGKDLSEYGTTPYHLIDVVNPDEDYNLMRFRNEIPVIIQQINEKCRLPIVCGGSALYIDSLISNYSLPGRGQDPEGRKTLHGMATEQLAKHLEEIDSSASALNDRKNRNRLVRAIEIARFGGFSAQPLQFEPEILILGVFFHRKEVHKRIEMRLDIRLENGMIEEVRRLHEAGLPWGRLEFFGLEYRYLAYYLQGKMTYKEMRGKLLEKIRQFAKRQDIWFRKMEREGHVIHWIEEGECSIASELTRLFLDGKPLPDPELKISEVYYGEKSS